MNKNNITKIQLRWLLFVGMVTFFTMLSNSTAVSSENEEEKDSFEQTTQNNNQAQNSFFNASVDYQLISQASNLFLTAAKQYYKDNQELVNKEINAVITSQNVFAELKQQIATSDELDIQDKINALEACAHKRSDVIEKGIANVNTVMSILLDQKNTIMDSKLDHVEKAIDIYKNLHTESMKAQITEWGQQIKRKEAQLAFEVDKARRNYLFSIKREKEALALKQSAAAYKAKKLEQQAQFQAKKEALESKQLAAAQKAAYQNRKRQAELQATQNELKLNESAAAQEQEKAKKSTTHTGIENGYNSKVDYRVEIYASGKVEVNFRLICYSSAKKHFRLAVTLKDSGKKKLDSFMTPNIEVSNSENKSKDYSFNISPQTVKKVTKVDISFRWAAQS